MGKYQDFVGISLETTDQRSKLAGTGAKNATLGPINVYG
jgi:hypothetical protein